MGVYIAEMDYPEMLSQTITIWYEIGETCGYA